MPSLITTDLPLRLDRLPWSPFHWRVVIALGITWLLDGLEVTVVGALASVLERSDTLALSSTQVGLAGSAYLAGAISLVFFFGSAAASAAYLTVSEVFPIELRALAIAAFYAIGTAAGGLGAPALFGYLIERGERSDVFIGYAIGATLMGIAALVAAKLGVAAERKGLEEIAEPLSARRAPSTSDFT